MPGQSRFALAIRRLSSRNQKRFYRRLFQSQTAITGYGGREADAHARAGLHLQEYDQQSDSWFSALPLLFSRSTFRVRASPTRATTHDPPIPAAFPPGWRCHFGASLRPSFTHRFPCHPR